MSTTATTVTSLDGFHATPTAQRADELARAFFAAVNADGPARTDRARRGRRHGRRRLHPELRLDTGRPSRFRERPGDQPRAMPEGRALQTHMVAENNRVASRSVWDATLTGSGQPVDFTTLDFFRIQDGLIAEHWESVDWVRAYQSFGLLSEGVDDA